MVSVVFPLLDLFLVCTLMCAPCAVLVWALCVLQNRNLNSEDAGKQWDHRTHWTLYLSRRNWEWGVFLSSCCCVPSMRAQWLRSVSNCCSCFMWFLHIIPHLVLLQVFEVYWCPQACDLFKNPCKFNVHWPACHTCEPLFYVFQVCHLQTTRTSCKGQAWKIYSLEQHW